MYKTNKVAISCIAGLIFSLVSLISFAANISPVGKWKSIDDVTHKPRSIVKIWTSKGILYGKILKIYKQPGDTGFCEHCSGHFKGKPVVGLTILWGLKRKGTYKWTGGHVIDPKSGNIYRGSVTIAKDGKNLNLRGYIMIPLFGRSQTWIRINS